MTRNALRSFASLALVSTSIAACAMQSSPTHPGGAEDDGAGGGGGSAPGPGPASTGAAGGGSFAATAGAGSSGTGGFSTCASSSQDAALVPVSMFLAVDKSGSMADDHKWASVDAAFTSFFDDPAADTLRVALRLFPQGKCSAPACSVAECSQPDVDVGPLSDPAQVKALLGALASVTPGGNTPMAAALQGATDWAVGHAGQVGASEKVVVILVTDGQPNGCGDKVNLIAAEAKNAYAAAGVMTFAVGLVGSNPATMDTIAEAGHTTKAFFIGNGDAQAELLAALQTIETQSASCTYAMPQAAAGQTIDPQLVNVTYQEGSAAAPETFGQVAGAASCGAKGGWYYDDPQKPAFIDLCPVTCQDVKADPSAKIQIVLGCATEIE